MIEQELWRIFTFYSLHGDPTQPENMRPAHFLRFCKDCQILSRKINPTAIELEVSKLARMKSNNSEFNSSITLSFADFLQLLDILAQKVYSKDAPELAVKRLLLENILLLSNRRVPATDLYDLDHAEANKIVREIYGKCLQKIFDYYLDIATKRRNHALTAEKMLQRDLRASTNRDITALAATKAMTVQLMKEQAKHQKDLIGYKEYVQFCHDFNLKSTSLLTAIQVGEIFLNIVPLNLETKSEVGMSFDMFCRAIIYMAFLAYRDVDARITPASKVKAILLFMWKAVNDSEKTMRMISNNRSNTLSHFAGSLNVFGSGAFSDLLLSNWVKDNFIDYATFVVDNTEKSGVLMLKSVVSEAGESKETPVVKSVAESSEGKMDALLEGVQKSLNLNSVPKTAPAHRRTNSILITHFSTNLKARAVERQQNNPTHSQVNRKMGSNVILEGRILSKLLSLKPELAEYLYMEVENMKISSTPFEVK